MKKCKKFGMILLAAAMLLSLATVALAAEGAPTATVTVKDSHQYMAYQIFTGDSQDVTDDNGPIGGIKWGNGINEDKIGAFVDALKADETIKEYFDDGVTADAASVAEALSDIPEKNQSALRAFARVAKEFFTENGTKLRRTGTKLPLGYYLIVDITDVDDRASVKNDLILQLSRDITVTRKYDVPSSEKKVKDNKEGSEYGRRAAYAIGDKIPFRITAVIKDKNYDAYKTYVLKFVDTMSAGLSYNNDATIYWVAEGADATEPDTHQPLTSFTYSTEPYGGTEDMYKGGNVLTWTCNNIKDFKVPQGATVYLEYTATLNENATAGWYDATLDENESTDGWYDGSNQNMSHIEFSNDPESESMGKTKDYVVDVYTFQLNVHKKDGENKGLKGAEFTIYKLIPDDGVSFGDDAPEKADVPDDMSGYHWDGGKPLDGDSDGYTFHAKGLDEGWYKLVESTVPAGYNKAEDIVFKVEADFAHNELKDTGAEGIESETTLIPATRNEGWERVPSGILSTDVVNQKGLTLPETGGIGTTIFYVLGAALVIGAAVLLVVRKRMSKYDG